MFTLNLCKPHNTDVHTAARKKIQCSVVRGFPAAWNDSVVSGYTVLYNKALQFGSSSFGMFFSFLISVIAGPDLKFQPGEELRKA